MQLEEKSRSIVQNSFSPSTSRIYCNLFELNHCQWKKSFLSAEIIEELNVKKEHIWLLLTAMFFVIEQIGRKKERRIRCHFYVLFKRLHREKKGGEE